MFVVTNALRLNLFRLYRPGKSKAAERFTDRELNDCLGDQIQPHEREETTMTKTMKIEGMMCAHCEAAVRKALEAIDGVESAAASHTEKQAIVTLSKEVADEVLKKAVEDKDYQVLSISNA